MKTMRPLERAEISLHEVKVLVVLKDRPGQWMTNSEIAGLVEFSERTVRAHTLRFVKLGMIDQAEVYPAHRYRWSAKDSKRNASYAIRLDKAREVFGI